MTSARTGAGDALLASLRASCSPCRVSSGGREAAVRCPYCGDSSKHASSAHLYVSLLAPFKWYCQRCSLGGRLNARVLRDLGSRDGAVAVAVEAEARAAEDRARTMRPTVARASSFEAPPPGSGRGEPGMEYLRLRTGLKEMTWEEAARTYRVSFGLTPYLDHNRVDWINMSPRDERRVLPAIDEYGVGFVSSDGMSVEFRARDEAAAGFRYRSYELDPDWPSSRVYAVATTADAMERRLVVCVAEGALDIICVHAHLWGGRKQGVAFLAASGKGFRRALLGLIAKGFLDLEVHVYSDPDVGPGAYAALLGSDDRLACQEYWLHYNASRLPAKPDWGLPPGMIEDTRSRLRLGR